VCAADFRGDYLYPLVGLKGVHPDLYERELVKYIGRESVLRYIVPGLNVSWGETVNLSALDPAHLLAERSRLGIPFSNLLTRRVLRIPLDRIAGYPAVTYSGTVHWANSSPHDPKALPEPPAGDFAPFDPATHQEPQRVPALHTEYLLRQLARGEHALGFVFIPHVLVASPINVSGLVPSALTDA
jgi:hypothetical protein